jgi:hypothetical protein
MTAKKKPPKTKPKRAKASKVVARRDEMAKENAARKAEPAPVVAELVPIPGTMLEQSEEAVKYGLDGIRWAMAETMGRLQGKDGEPPPDKFDTALSSHLCYLQKHATAAMDGLRKMENHARLKFDALDPDEMTKLLIGWIEEQPVERRDEIRAKLDELDKGRSLLG